MGFYKVGAYLRISKNDSEDTDSNSIINQKAIIEQYIKKQENMKLVECYIDDGYSGTNFNRPGFKQMLLDIKDKKIDAIIVKDLSRLGRNHIEVDNFVENIFLAMNIRFICVIEEYDSSNFEDVFDDYYMSLKSLMNDAYAKDISKKTKSAFVSKRKNGEFIGAVATYGYIKSPDDKHKFIIDKEAFEVVSFIFKEALNGKSTGEIAFELNKKNVLKPAEYKNSKHSTNHKESQNNKWSANIVLKILQNQTYTGDLVQGRKKSENYRTHKLVDTKKEDWIISENHHKAVVSKEEFKKVQELISGRKAQTNKDGKVDLFYGYLKCGECDSKFRKSGKYYYCDNYARTGGCTKHSTNREKLIKHIESELKKKQEDLKELSRELLFQLVDVIIIYENGSIKIKYKSGR